MDIKELNEIVRNNQKEVLEKKIEEIEEGIIWRADNGFNNFEVTTYVYDDYYYTIRKWMIEPLRNYFIDEGYKIEIRETKSPTKWFDKMLGIYEPEYSMIISW